MRDSLPFLADLLSIPIADPQVVELDEKSKYIETLIALRNLVQSIGEISPQTLLVLEDLHCLDSSSQQALEFLLANCDLKHPLLLLCLYRPWREDEKPSFPKVHKNYALIEEITLSVIKEDACRKLIKNMLSTDETLQNYRSALEIHREVGDRRSEGILLGNLGNLDWAQGRLDEAQKCYKKTLTCPR